MLQNTFQYWFYVVTNLNLLFNRYDLRQNKNLILPLTKSTQYFSIKGGHEKKKRKEDKSPYFHNEIFKFKFDTHEKIMVRLPKRNLN